jgi:pimeloyl-ACP methyl ester carboxylesterase
MTLPGLVLIHGGAHAADSWDLVAAELHSTAPELRVLAVDLRVVEASRATCAKRRSGTGWIRLSAISIRPA